MNLFTLDNKPECLVEHRKAATVHLAFLSEPFTVVTQEGAMEIGPHTVDDWGRGYYIAYPSDGSKPYAISEKYVRDNYVVVTP